MWTPPHFWALALYRAGDYAAAGVPMLPVVAGARATKRQMLVYTLLLLPLALAPWPLGLAGAVYARGGAALLGLRLHPGARCAVWCDSERARRRARCSASRSSICSCCSPLLIVDRAPGLLGGSAA